MKDEVILGNVCEAKTEQARSHFIEFFSKTIKLIYQKIHLIYNPCNEKILYIIFNMKSSDIQAA